MVYIGSDHRGFILKEAIKKYFDKQKIEYEDCGTYSTQTAHYPQIAENVCKKMDVKKDTAILLCGSGIGMSIAANKFKGIRAGICNSLSSVEDGKAHDDINVLVLPADFIDEQDAFDIIDKWINLEFLNGRYLDRLKMIEKIEEENMK